MSVRAGVLAGRSAAGQVQAAGALLTARPLPWPGLVGIGLLAAGLWTYHVIAAVMISPDSALFIEYAQHLGSDPLGAVKAYDQHPLFPALILFFRLLCGRFWSEGAAGWVLAGRLAGLTGYLGAVLAAYALAARAYDRRIGLIAAAMVTLLPDASHFAADVLSDMPHLALYLAALAALVIGLETQHRARWLLGSAALSALAFLTRPEGGAVLLIGVVFVVFRRDWRLSRRIALALSMAAVFAAISSPYQAATGRLIKKKSLLHLLQFGLGDEQAALEEKGPQGGDAPGPPAIAYAGLDRGHLLVPINVIYQWGRATRVVYAIPALIGLFLARPRRPPGQILATAFALQAVLLCALQSTYGYLDRRHALLLAVLAMPLAAAGVMYVACQIRPARSPNAIVAGIIGICALVTAPWLLRPVNRGDEHVRAAARWFAENTPSDALLVGNRRLHRAALCADRAFAEWPWYQGRVSELADFLRQHARPATYLAVDTLLMTTPPRPAGFMDDLRAALGRQLDLAFSAAAPPGAAPTEIRIYAYHGGGRP
jgi:hypothetical protein